MSINTDTAKKQLTEAYEKLLLASVKHSSAFLTYAHNFADRKDAVEYLNYFADCKRELADAALLFAEKHTQAKEAGFSHVLYQ